MMWHRRSSSLHDEEREPLLSSAFLGSSAEMDAEAAAAADGETGDDGDEQAARARARLAAQRKRLLAQVPE